MICYFLALALLPEGRSPSYQRHYFVNELPARAEVCRALWPLGPRAIAAAFVESGFRWGLISKRGAIGPLQIMAEHWGNAPIKGAVRALRWCAKRVKSPPGPRRDCLVHACYHGERWRNCTRAGRGRTAYLKAAIFALAWARLGR
jgi:hypothetical protein